MHLLSRRFDINKNKKISISEIRTIFNNVTGKSSAIEEHRHQKEITVHSHSKLNNKVAMTSPRKKKDFYPNLTSVNINENMNTTQNIEGLDSSFNNFKLIKFS